MDSLEPQTSNGKSSSSLPLELVEANRKGMAKFSLVALGLFSVLTGLLVVGLLPRLQRQAELQVSAKEAKTNLLTVNTVTAHRAPTTSELMLPGNIQGQQETTIYARTNGYLSKRLVDIGDRVKAGQLLAQIESPETDRELEQAHANLAQSRAAYMQARANFLQAQSSLLQVQTNSDLAHVSSQRWETLEKQGAVSHQDFDEKYSAYKASTANVKAAEATVKANQSSIESAMANVSANTANVRRLEATQSFKQIIAPFDGVITARNIDTGSLITAGSSGANAVWLYKIAQPKMLRIFVNVPQTYIQSIHPGETTANILVRELPNQVFTGKVVRSAKALDQTSHTLLTEVQVPNPDLKLLPGMFAQVKFILNQASAPLMIPANVLVVRANGPQVALVGEDQTVHYQKVALGRDYGSEIEITSGLSGNESLIVNPTDDIVEGIKVRGVAAKQKLNH